MPSLKIGCRVDFDGHGPAVIKDFDPVRPKPWLLAAGGRMVWADHTEFRNPDHAANPPPRSMPAVFERGTQFRRGALSRLWAAGSRFRFAPAGLHPR